MTTPAPGSSSSLTHVPSTSTASWLAVGSLAISTFASVTTEFMPVGLLPNIAAGLGVSEGTAGLMVTVPAVVAALTGPILIIFANRLDRRAVLLLLSTLLVASNVISALSPHIAVMLLGRSLLGLCVGGFWTLAPGVAGHLVPLASCRAPCLTSWLGYPRQRYAASPLTAFVGNSVGWRAAFITIALLAAVVLAIQIRVLPRLPPSQVTRTRDLLLPITDAGARTVLLATVLIVLAHFGAYTYLQPMLRQEFGLAPAAVAVLLLIYGLTGLVGTLAGGRLVALGARNILSFAAALIAAVLLAAALMGGSTLLGVVVVSAWGIGFGLIPVSVTAWMVERLPNEIDAGQALLVVAFQVAISSGSLFGGVIADHFGISDTLLCAAVLAVLCAAVAATKRPMRAVASPC